MYKISCTYRGEGRNTMVTRRVGISEARRLLPELVRSVAAEGGRVDITYRGKAQVSLLRVSDIKGEPRGKTTSREIDPALRIRIKFPKDDLEEAIRQMRAMHQPRTAWLDKKDPKPRGQRAPSAQRRGARK